MATKRKKKIAKSLKIFFSGTRSHRALIFGMKHLLVDIYDTCGVKTGPGGGGGGGGGVTSSKHRNKEGKLENSSSLKVDGAEL